MLGNSQSVESLWSKETSVLMAIGFFFFYQLLRLGQKVEVTVQIGIQCCLSHILPPPRTQGSAIFKPHLGQVPPRRVTILQYYGIRTKYHCVKPLTVIPVPLGRGPTIGKWSVRFQFLGVVPCRPSGATWTLSPRNPSAEAVGLPGTVEVARTTSRTDENAGQIATCRSRPPPQQQQAQNWVSGDLFASSTRLRPWCHGYGIQGFPRSPPRINRGGFPQIWH